MKILAGLCLLAVTLCLCAALLEFRKLAHDADVSVRISDGVQAKANQLLTDANRTVIIIGATATNVEKASRAWEKSSQEQASQTTMAMSNVSAAAKQLTTSISSVEQSTSGLLWSTQSAITQQNAELSETQQILRQSLNSANALLANPKWDETLGGLAATLTNTASTTGHLSEMAGSGERIVKHYEATLTKPVGTIRTLAEFILDNGYKIKAFIP